MLQASGVLPALRTLLSAAHEGEVCPLRLVAHPFHRCRGTVDIRLGSKRHGTACPHTT